MNTYVADMNHNNPVEFAKLAKSGCVGVIHKATQGLSFTDNQYAIRRALAEEHGLEWGAYDFNEEDDIKSDVEKFFAVAKPNARTLMALDFERNEKSDMTIFHALEFLDRADQRLGRRLAIYGGDKIKREIVRLSAPQREFLGQHPLWGCQYGPRWKNFDDHGHELPWKETFLWQFTGDGVGPLPHTLDGLEMGADISSFNGTADELRAAWPLPTLLVA